MNATSDPIAAVRTYVDAFNRGDATAMATTFAASGLILDGMAPHVWQGPTATRDYQLLSDTPRAISLLWESRCITTSTPTAPMWSFPRR